MHTDGLRRKKLSILRRRRVDVRAQIKGMVDEAAPAENPALDDLIRKERKLERQIGVLHCARLDLL